MLLSETRHVADSVSIRRLRAEDYQVIERARRRVRDITRSTNHGGVAVVAVRGIRLYSDWISVSQPTTFEQLYVRVTSGSSSCIVLLLYRPGSTTITADFFSDVSDVLDRLTTFIDPVIVAGDVNIRLDRADEPTARRFNELMVDYGMSSHVTSTTHDRGGLLDVVMWSSLVMTNQRRSQRRRHQHFRPHAADVYHSAD